MTLDGSGFGAGASDVHLEAESRGNMPWLFFFATGEGGRHTFSQTFAEHNRKRRELNR